MTFAPVFFRRWRETALPISLLIGLLQRSPALRVVEAGEDLAASAPVAAILRSAVAAAASLGTLHTLAGATTVIGSPATPLNATVGVSVAAAFVVSGSQAPASSWSISGSIPPGLNFQGLTGPGKVNVETIDGHATMSGTPTTAGTFHMTMIAWEDPNATGASSPTFNYTVVVSANASAPSFTTQPQSQTVNVGQSVTFTAASSGAPTYQWQFNGTAIAGATGATFTLTNVQAANGGSYTVSASNSSGSTTSDTALLTVVNPTALPVFTVQPVSQTISVGTNLTFTAAAVGNPSYQWFDNGVETVGRRQSHRIRDGDPVDQQHAAIECRQLYRGGDQRQWIHHEHSGDAQLQHCGQRPRPDRRAGGADDRNRHHRDLFGFRRGSPRADLSMVFQRKHPDFRRHRLHASSDARHRRQRGQLFVHRQQFLRHGVGSLAATLGVTPTTNVGRLINLSVNTTAGKSQVLTVGFVTGGSGTVGSQNLLIRATGPALAAFGVPNTLVDPTLSVLSGPTVVASNDNWGTPATNQAAVTAADNVTGAFPLSNPASLDAAGHGAFLSLAATPSRSAATPRLPERPSPKFTTTLRPIPIR